MSSKIIIIATIVLLIVSFSILFVVEAKNHNLDYKKSWSVVYFENPRDNSLDFVVENHQGEGALYKYKIFVNDEKMIEKDVNIDAGEKQKISPVIGENSGSGKITVEVGYKDVEYKIYKNLSK